MSDTPKQKDPYLEELDSQMKRLRRLTTEHLMCRQGALAHAWHLVQPDFDSPTRGTKAVAQQCSRCLTIKRYVVSLRYGERIGNATYEYPDGYTIRKMPDEIGPISSQAVRAVFMKRVTPDMVAPMIVLHEDQPE